MADVTGAKKRPFPPILLAAAAAGMVIFSGCSGIQEYNYHWETFEVDAKNVEEERMRLAQCVRQVLVHRGFFPEKQEKMEAPGHEGQLVTSWNDEEARLPQGSYQGHRYQVAVKLVEGTEHLTHTPKDPIAARYVEMRRAERPGRIRLALGLACMQERNQRMNWHPGDYQQAEWRSAGAAPAVAMRLMDEVRRAFFVDGRSDAESGLEGSARTLRIMERGSDYATPTQNKSYGPADTPSPSSYDFGTRGRP